MDRERVQEYFQSRMPEHPDLEVIELFRISGGMSRETWFADLRGADGFEKRLTIRLDHPSGSVVPVPIEWEFNVLDCLQRTAVPAAAPFWYETDASLIGRAPFYVRDNVPGTASFRELYAEEAEELRADIGRQFAELLAAVHTSDWEAAGFGRFMAVPKSAQDCALLELARYRRHYEAHRSEPKPVMAELLTWLERNAPTSVARVSLVWGDVGLGNLIFDEGKIVALTDWEQSHLGDPMKDWASALWRGLNSLLPEEELFRIYEAASGIAVDADAVRYYRAFIDAQYVCTSHSLIDELIEGRFDDATFVRLGLGVPFYCLDDGLNVITG